MLSSPLPPPKKSGLFSGKGLPWGTLHQSKSFLHFCEMWVGVGTLFKQFYEDTRHGQMGSCRYDQVCLRRHAGTKAQADNGENIEPHILPHPSFFLKDAIYFRYKSTANPYRPAVAVILTLYIIYCILGNLS